MKKRICAMILSVTISCANAQAFAQGIWGTQEQIIKQWDMIEKYSAGVDFSWVETTENEVILRGRFSEKEGMPVTALISGDGIIEMMQGTVGAGGYYSFFISDDNFVGGNEYSIRIACVNSIENIEYYHRTNEDNTQILSEINNNVTDSILNNSKLNLNLSNYDTLLNKQLVLSTLNSYEYNTVNEFVKAFYDAVYMRNRADKNLTYYVSKTGNDANSGTKDAPFKTVTKAYELVSNLIRNGEVGSDVNIIISDGEYFIDNTLYFDSENTSGNYSINFVAENNGKAVITGGETIIGFNEYADNIYVKNIGANRDIKMIYNNNEMMYIARYPNKGSLEYDMPSDYALSTAAHTKVRRGMYIDSSILNGTENNTDLEIAVWPNGSDDGHWMWYMNIVDVLTADSQTGLVTFKKDTTHDIGRGAKFYIQNDIKFLDAENEFYYDSKSGNLYIWAESENELDIVVPLVDDIVEFENAQNVKFEGIKVRNSKRTKDYTYGYKTLDSGNGFRISNSNNVTIKNCIVANVGGHGINLVNSGEDNLVTGNHIYNTFGTGISINGEENLSEMIFVNNEISNNYVHSTGLVVLSSTGIALYHSGSDKNVIKNNLIHNCPRSAIRVTDTNGTNYITYNDVFDVNKGSQDTGVIYVEGLGENAQTHIENNYIHDSKSWIEQTIGLYLDDLAFGTIAKNNIIANLSKSDINDVDNFGYAMHLKASNIVVENNYVIDNPEAGAMMGTYAQHSKADNISVVRNVFSNSGKTVYIHSNYDENRLKVSDYNLFDVYGNAEFRVKGSLIMITKTLKQWQDEYNKDINSVFASAQISDSKNYDFRLLEISPAFELGIDNIDIANIGLTEDFVYNIGDNAPHRVFVREESQSKDSTTFDIVAGQTKQLNTYVRNKTGMICKNVSYTYTSENSSIASVDNEGRVTAKNSGSTKITVTVTDGTVSKQSYIIAKVSLPFANITKIECYDSNNTLVNTALKPIENVIVNYNGNYIGGDIIAAIYDKNNKLLGLRMGKLDKIEGSIVLNVGYDGKEADKVKAFVWNLGTLYPVAYKELAFTQ